MRSCACMVGTLLLAFVSLTLSAFIDVTWIRNMMLYIGFVIVAPGGMILMAVGYDHVHRGVFLPISFGINIVLWYGVYVALFRYVVRPNSQGVGGDQRSDLSE